MRSHSQRPGHRRPEPCPSLDQRLKAEDKTPGAESGPEAKANSLGSKPRSGSRPEAEQLDFVVATEQEFEEVLAISGDIYGASTTFPAATTADSGIPTALWCWPSAMEEW